jgi:hypothetical protein
VTGHPYGDDWATIVTLFLTAVVLIAVIMTLITGGRK